MPREDMSEVEGVRGALPLTKLIFSCQGEEFKAQLRRGIPVALSSLCRRSLDIVTVAVLGHLGSESLAAGAVRENEEGHAQK